MSEEEQVAWEWFAKAHPHEAYADDPERFWRFFHRENPKITREQMEQTLNETMKNL